MGARCGRSSDSRGASPSSPTSPPPHLPACTAATASSPCSGRNSTRSTRARPCARRSACCAQGRARVRSEEHTSELQSHSDLVCRLLLEKKKKNKEDQKTQAHV